jgi:hypothetical protein
MNDRFELLVTLVIVTLTITVFAVSWLAFRSRSRSATATWAAGAFLGAWFIAAYWSASVGFYAPVNGQRVPNIVLALLPLAIAYAAYLRVPAIRDAVNAIPLEWIVGVQLYRMLGFMFIIEWTLHQLPSAFALPAGIGDVIVGALAVPVALGLRGATPAKSMGIVWNLFGIADLIQAVALGYLSSPGPSQLFAFATPNLAISRLPLVLVPIGLVPFSILLHLIAMHRLLALPRSQAQGTMFPTRRAAHEHA